MLRIMFQVIILGTTLHFFAAHCRAQDRELIRDGSPALMLLESDLNDTYIEAVSNAKRTRTPEEIENIKDSESKWRAYRNAECKAENGGDACLIRFTRQRIAALKSLYPADGR